jgi:hypothetical protein
VNGEFDKNATGVMEGVFDENRAGVMEPVLVLNVFVPSVCRLVVLVVRDVSREKEV